LSDSNIFTFIRYTDFSLLDGYGMCEEYAKRAKEINQKFLCVSDHGVMGAVPRQIRACEKNKISPIFACELYVNPRQMELKPGESSGDYVKQMSDDERALFRKSYHLLAIAYNETGYSNLVKMSSWGWTKGFYYRPRINHDVLLAHREGIIFTSCCYNGEIGQAFDKGGEEPAMAMVEKYIAMFGTNFRLELMLLDFIKQKPFDAFIIKAHNKYGIPLIVTNDCHYCKKEDSRMQRLMLMVQTNRTIQDIQDKLAEDETADMFELQDQNLWMKSEEEINEKWEKNYSDVIDSELLEQAKLNTVAVCEQAKGVQLDRSIKLPKIEDADDKLLEAIQIGFKERDIPMTQEYRDRIKEEYNLIKNKGFSSYFLIQKMMTDEARRISPILLGWGDGSEAVGPGRGSVCGSLVAYAIGITDVDPIKHDLLFSRFLSPARGGRSMKIRFSSDPIQQTIEQIVQTVNPADDCPFDVE
jgi:DNA polymerase-3 subunit alpha